MLDTFAIWLDTFAMLDTFAIGLDTFAMLDTFAIGLDTFAMLDTSTWARATVVKGLHGKRQLKVLTVSGN